MALICESKLRDQTYDLMNGILVTYSKTIMSKIQMLWDNIVLS